MRLCVPRVHKHTLQSESCKHAVAQVASGSGDAKVLRQNQEWPKKVVFRRACRTHTLALSMIRAHTWLSVACLDCLQAPGEIAAGISLLPPWLLPSLLPSLLPLLPFSLPPYCHLRPHPTFALTRVGLPARAALQPLAGVWSPPGRGKCCTLPDCRVTLACYIEGFKHKCW